MPGMLGRSAADQGQYISAIHVLEEFKLLPHSPAAWRPPAAPLEPPRGPRSLPGAQFQLPAAVAAARQQRPCSPGHRARTPPPLSPDLYVLRYFPVFLSCAVAALLFGSALSVGPHPL